MPRCRASTGCADHSPKGHGGIWSVLSSKSWIVYYVLKIESGLVFRVDGFWAQKYDVKRTWRAASWMEQNFQRCFWCLPSVLPMQFAVFWKL